MKNIFFLFIFTFICSHIYASEKDSIFLGDFLSDEQLKSLDNLHRGLSHFSNIKYGGPEIYTDVYAWYDGIEKKTIYVLSGSNQVVWHTIEIKDYECEKFLELYKARRTTSEEITLDYFRANNNFNAHWTEWNQEARFGVYGIYNLKEYFASEEKDEILKPLRYVTCKTKDNITELSEMAFNSLDEENEYTQYLSNLNTFPNITAFGHTLLEPIGNTEIINEIDVGIAEVKVSNPSSFFENYFLYYVPEKPKKIVRIKGEYIGESAQDIFFEVKRLLKKKYARQIFIALDNENSLIAKNALWQINLFMDLQNSSRLTIEYISKDRKTKYLRDELIDAIKSDSL